MNDLRAVLTKTDENEIFFPLFEKIDALLENGASIIAIEGGSASGKTTLASLLFEKYGATVFHMDDFFLTPNMRTPARLSEIGGNVDRERFESEVLIPLSKGEAVNYRPYDCKTCKIKEGVAVKPEKLVIVEGAYSTHPALFGYYDFTVFLDIDQIKQRERIQKRNAPEHARRFFEEWIPLENTYFEKTNAKQRCDLVISV